MEVKKINNPTTTVVTVKFDNAHESFLIKNMTDQAINVSIGTYKGDESAITIPANTAQLIEDTGRIDKIGTFHIKAIADATGIVELDGD